MKRGPWGEYSLHRRVVEERDRRRGERGGVEHRVVGEAGEDGQARLRAAGAVPAGVALAAAEEAERLHRVGRGEVVGVARHDEGGGLDAGDLLGEVEVLEHQGADLGEQAWPVLLPRSDAAVELVHMSRNRART